MSDFIASMLFKHSKSMISNGWVKPNDNKIGICCFSAKHATLRSKIKDWLDQNRGNVSNWRKISTSGLLFQWASSENPAKHVCLVQSRHHHHLTKKKQRTFCFLSKAKTSGEVENAGTISLLFKLNILNRNNIITACQTGMSFL